MREREKTEIFKDLIKEIVGIDIDPYKIKKAKDRGILTILGSALDLPFKNNSFDLVTSLHVIEHIKHEQVTTFISEILRVLKPGGFFIIITPNRRRLTSAVNILLRLVSNKCYPMNPDHKFEYTIEDLKKLFLNNNIKVLIIPIGFIPLGLRLRFIEIPKIPKFLYKYSDQLLVIGNKEDITILVMSTKTNDFIVK